MRWPGERNLCVQSYADGGNLYRVLLKHTFVCWSSLALFSKQRWSDVWVVRLRASTRRFLPPLLALCRFGSVWSRPVALHRELGCRGYPRLLGVRAPACL